MIDSFENRGGNDTDFLTEISPASSSLKTFQMETEIAAQSFMVEEPIFGDETKQIYRDDFETHSRHFTSTGYQKVNELIARIANEDPDAKRELWKTIQPWMRYSLEHTGTRILNGSMPEKQNLDEIMMDIFSKVTEKIRTGKTILWWSQFTVRFLGELDRSLKMVRDNSSHVRILSLEKDIPQTSLLESNDGDEGIVGEPASIPLHETIASTAYAEHHQLYDMEMIELRETLQRAIGKLSAREREVLKLRHPDEGPEKSLEEIGAMQGITKERIRQIEQRALHNLQSSAHDSGLQDFAPEERTLAILEKEKAAKRKRLGESRKFTIPVIIRPLVREQRIIINDILRGTKKFVHRKILSERMGLDIEDVEPLYDTNSPKFHDLLRTLSPENIEQLTQKLPELGIPEEKIKLLNDAVAKLQQLVTQGAETGAAKNPNEVSG